MLKVYLIITVVALCIFRIPAYGSEQKSIVVQPIGIEMVFITGGEFDMGSNNGSVTEKPVHRVKLSNFWIAKSEVTQRQWVQLMNYNNSQFKGCDDCPVDMVSWIEIQEFIKKLNTQTGKAFRLPTEAEWEYSAGGGNQHQKWAGTNSDNELGKFAWFKSNSGNKTHPVCEKAPNSLGLCDMSGNAWEWCNDWWGAYTAESKDNPQGPPTGEGHPIRGGGYANGPTEMQITIRSGLGPNTRLAGFRLVLAK